MGDRLYFQQIADDLAVLYELSLSIGQSLDLRDNCARFLTALMARRNLSYAAVWLRSGLLGEPSSEPDGFELFWGRPHAHIQERLLPEDHQIAQRLREVPRFSCSSEDPLFDGYVTERQVESGTFAVFALGELGFLKLLALRRPEALLDSELRFLSGIVNKFAVSLEGCVAHTRLVRQMDQRRRAEAALQESEAQLRAILDHTPACIFVKGLDGRYIMVNRRFEELFQDRSFVGKTDAELFPAPVARALRANDARVMETGRAAEFEETITGDEMSRHYLTAKFPIRDDKGAPYGVCGVAFEITDRKRAEDERRQLERQMQQAQKLESLGILAGGIAHDFNNLLTGILGNANLALSAVDADSAAYRNLTQIETAALRAAELTNQMLAYSGKGRLITETIDLSEVASEMTTLLLSAIPKKTTIRSNLTPEEAIIDGDPGQIRQVVMNLITNASDAIGRRIGQITLTTRITSLEQEKLEHIHPDEALDDIPYVMLEVRDNGKGMGEDTTARIFDPFFTTKFTGRGLGLAAVLGIVRSHRGAITFESQPGSGTVFRVLFPQSRERIDDAPAADVRETSWSGEGTVLVVDDDPAAREVMELTVQRMGCETLSATNGKEGVDIYRQRWQEISLILLDLTMPVMGGEEAIEEMRRIDPDAKIILVSGYSEQDAIENFADRALSGFVQKPFLPATLVHMIRKVL